jgi:thioredoxin reductase
MANDKTFDVIIIGGSYAGLSAAMSLGRAFRKVLVIDSGKPCNKQTPHSHNFITQDGQTPGAIHQLAKSQVEKYKTIEFFNGIATSGVNHGSSFEISTDNGNTFFARKILFTTGVTDIMPDIKGFGECWGISVLHCPYCHGYEVGHQKLGVLTNGDMGFQMSRLISNWTKDLTLFTNGKSTLTDEQTEKLRKNNISIVEKEIEVLNHDGGYLKTIEFKDGSNASISALFAKIKFRQHCDIPEKLGAELDENGYLKVDEFGKTSVPGIYAAGDASIMFRAVSGAVAAGSKAGAFINHEIIHEDF